MEFSGFPKGALSFLQDIKENNTKEWFEAHKSEYEKLILEPSRAFVVEMGEHLMALEPAINFEPKINKSLFRIYRDTRRMGANKAPIKHRIGFIFWQGGAKRMQSSSFYMHFSPDELFVAAGVRWFEKPMLDAYREFIKDDSRRQRVAQTAASLKDKGYSLMRKGYKRYPRGFNADMENAQLSLYDGMAAYKILEPSVIENGGVLIETLYNMYEELLPMQGLVYEVSLGVKEE